MRAKIVFISHVLNVAGITILIPAMILLITTDVVLRFIFNSPLTGAHEVEGLMLILLFFFSLTHCWNVNGHVRLDHFLNKFGEQRKGIVKALSGAIAAFIFGLFVYQMYLDTLFAIQLPMKTPEIEMPYWPFYVVVGFCGLLFTIQASISCYEGFKQAVSEEK